MVRGRDGNRVDILVFQKLANIDLRLRLGDVHLLGIGDPLSKNVFVYVAEIGNLNPRNG